MIGLALNVLMDQRDLPRIVECSLLNMTVGTYPLVPNPRGPTCAARA